MTVKELAEYFQPEGEASVKAPSGWHGVERTPVPGSSRPWPTHMTSVPFWWLAKAIPELILVSDRPVAESIPLCLAVLEHSAGSIAGLYAVIAIIPAVKITSSFCISPQTWRTAVWGSLCGWIQLRNRELDLATESRNWEQVKLKWVSCHHPSSMEPSSSRHCAETRGQGALLFPAFGNFPSSLAV